MGKSRFALRVKRAAGWCEAAARPAELAPEPSFTKAAAPVTGRRVGLTANKSGTAKGSAFRLFERRAFIMSKELRKR